MKNTSRPVLHLISQAHLDPVWLWPLRDGVAETLATCQSAADRLAEAPAFRFTRSSAAAYRWIRDSDPRLFADIHRDVAAGRWEVVGGWVEQPDCNLPSSESFLRQALHGQRFFTEAFGPERRASIGYNVDSFGHCGGIPQFLKLSGMDAYAFMRPEPWDNPDLPLLFQWESPDGSRVLGCRIPGCYSQSYAATADDIEKALREAPSKNFAPGFSHGVFWFGVGNHGGGPTREHIARVLELQEDPSLPEIRFSTLRDFLDAVLASPAAAKLPVWKGELGYVFRGCYAANGETKRLHRACEKALFSAEASEVAAGQSSVLRDAWWDLLNLQFHDILAGTCVASVQDDILHRFGGVLTRANDRGLQNALRLARQVDTRGENGSVLFAFNPLPWPRRTRVQIDTFRQVHGRDEVIALETPEGETLPIQWLRADANFGPWGLKWGKLTASVDLPAFGYRVLRVVTRRVSHDPDDITRAQDPGNPQFAGGGSKEDAPVVVDSPALASLKLSGVGEVLAAAVGFVVVKDTGGTWGHGKRAYDEVLGRPESLGCELLEDGPLLRVVREKFRWAESEIWMDVLRAPDTELVELRLRIHWLQKREQLKLEMSTRLTSATARAAMPGGAVARPADGAEVPCHDWVALEGKLGGKRVTLAVLNDSTYSCAADGGILRHTLARGVPHAEHPPFDYKDTRNVPFLDQGWQERRFALCAFAGEASAKPLDRWAQAFQIPALALPDNAHPGTAPRSQSFLHVEPDNVGVLALMPNEGGGTVLRLEESAGRPTEARITGPKHDITISLAAHEILTLRLDADGWWQYVDLYGNPL